MSGHTKGPIRIWAKPRGGGIILPEGRPYTVLIGNDRDEGEGTEYVRADVATDLLNACKRLLSSIHDHAETGEVHPFHTIETTEAHAALAKAEGRT